MDYETKLPNYSSGEQISTETIQKRSEAYREGFQEFPAASLAKEDAKKVGGL